MKNWNKKQRLCAAVISLVLLAVWTVQGNIRIGISEYRVESVNVPEAFSGFRIAQVSDLHNAEFGEESSILLERLTQAAPDMIVLTGDLIDSRNTNIAVALCFAEQAVRIAPVYYVTGNHEARVREYEALKSALTEAGVTVLEDQKVRINRDGEFITLMGIRDPSFSTDYLFGNSRSVVRQGLSLLRNEADGYTVLLSHRPELFDIYADLGIDLVFSGHAHGGQIRLPFVGGLAAPNQGFFPQYDAGQFVAGNTVMIVSRGVGNSIIPVRINNPPEIVVAELESP